MMYITWHKKPIGCSYHWTISKNAMNYKAFRTDASLGSWIKTHKIKLKLQHITRDTHDKSIILGKTYIVTNKDIKERTFYRKTEIPKRAKKVIGLSNGSYVDCYIIVNKTFNIVYRPNPNSVTDYKLGKLDMTKKHEKSYLIDSTYLKSYWQCEDKIDLGIAKHV